MATAVYTATVQENRSLTLTKEAQEALNLQPGDQIDVRIDNIDFDWDHDKLLASLAVGEKDIENGNYTVYTDETIHELVDKVEAEGRILLEQGSGKRAS